LQGVGRVVVSRAVPDSDFAGYPESDQIVDTLFFYIFSPFKRNVCTNFIPPYLGYVHLNVQINLKRVLIRKKNLYG